ncbi:MAG: carbamoyltransferase HypF [Myxococcota bacterium]
MTHPSATEFVPGAQGANGMEGRRIDARGTVQGVGFRPWVYRLAQRAGLRGRVKNHARGVTIEAFGPAHALDSFLRALRSDAPPAAEIVDLRWRSIPVEPANDFVIDRSESSGARSLSIPPDIATCDHCLAEVTSASDRRYKYAFTNCTECGPRFTITNAVPYDRTATTMAGFEMCNACSEEFHDPADRRFHAQPNACPACGPCLTLRSPDGRPIDCVDPIDEAAKLIRGGSIVGIKGLGGFHLACDATSSTAVLSLRTRKHRDEKPFAVMVRDLDSARALVHATESESAMLSSPERPIVLVRRQVDSSVAREVAPDTDSLGLLLPYTPLHHLLLAFVGRPLVMTSGNVAGEPICKDEREAAEHLGEVADALLTHDRPIAARCDDSVAKLIGTQMTILRRGRGFVPRAVRLRRPVKRPVLGCGAQLKNTFCIAVGDEAYLGPHIGDLDSMATIEFFEESVERLQSILGVEPEVIAHDMHPGYPSTRYALARDGRTKVAVQHHHAHVVSAMAEHHIEGPVLGIAFDGTGYGTDGTSWGGEMMSCSPEGFRRLVTFRPFGLPGGNVAMRDVWRASLGLLHDAFEGAPPVADLRLFELASAEAVRVAGQMVERDLNVPRVRGVGRFFDAVGALVLLRPRASFDGQIAVAWNTEADPREGRRYPFVIDRNRSPHEIDLRPMVRAIVEDLRRGIAAPTISAKFHNTLVRATVSAARELREEVGDLPLVLTGGAFQNSWLSQGIEGRLRGQWKCYRHGDVPPSDGGIALGQVVVADASVQQGARPCA